MLSSIFRACALPELLDRMRQATGSFCGSYPKLRPTGVGKQSLDLASVGTSWGQRQSMSPKPLWGRQFCLPSPQGLSSTFEPPGKLPPVPKDSSQSQRHRVRAPAPLPNSQSHKTIHNHKNSRPSWGHPGDGHPGPSLDHPDHPGDRASWGRHPGDRDLNS